MTSYHSYSPQSHQQSQCEKCQLQLQSVAVQLWLEALQTSPPVQWQTTSCYKTLNIWYKLSHLWVCIRNSLGLSLNCVMRCEPGRNLYAWDQQAHQCLVWQLGWQQGTDGSTAVAAVKTNCHAFTAYSTKPAYRRHMIPGNKLATSVTSGG